MQSLSAACPFSWCLEAPLWWSRLAFATLAGQLIYLKVWQAATSLMSYSFACLQKSSVWRSTDYCQTAWAIVLKEHDLILKKCCLVASDFQLRLDFTTLIDWFVWHHLKCDTRHLCCDFCYESAAVVSSTCSYRTQERSIDSFRFASSLELRMGRPLPLDAIFLHTELYLECVTFISCWMFEGYVPPESLAKLSFADSSSAPLLNEIPSSQVRFQDFSECHSELSSHS